MCAGCEDRKPNSVKPNTAAAPPPIPGYHLAFHSKPISVENRREAQQSQQVSTCPIQHVQPTTFSLRVGGGDTCNHRTAQATPHAPYSLPMFTAIPDRQGVASKRANDCQICCEGEETGWGRGTPAGEVGRVGRKTSIERYSALGEWRRERSGIENRHEMHPILVELPRTEALEKMMLVSAQSGLNQYSCVSQVVLSIILSSASL
jgi:hypothetical protein